MRNVRASACSGRTRDRGALPFQATAGAALYHVAGILVYASPAREHEVRGSIEALPGAQVHAHARGRIVATLEGTVSSQLAGALDAIQCLPGVLSAVLVSEHSEPIAGLDEACPHER